VAVIADPVFDAEDARVKKASRGSAATRLLVSRTAIEDRGLDLFPRDWTAGTGLLQIPRLLFSRREADGILSGVPPSERMSAVDFAANRETATGAQLAQYRLVHFATHGLLNDDHPELSGVVLSLVDEKGAALDGFMRLHDIYNLNLPADLVVLSACQTGLGREVAGEGIVGLTRGFMYAGAARVVVSLWKVDDEASAELMRHFYRRMLGPEHLHPAAALRAAQEAIRRQDRWRHPYYWAGFILEGEWR